MFFVFGLALIQQKFLLLPGTWYELFHSILHSTRLCHQDSDEFHSTHSVSEFDHLIQDFLLIIPEVDFSSDLIVDQNFALPKVFVLSALQFLLLKMLLFHYLT